MFCFMLYFVSFTKILCISKLFQCEQKSEHIWFQEQGHWENSMNIFMGRPTTKSSTTPVYLHMHQLAVICNNHKLYLIRSLQCKETRITQFMERTLSIKEKREKKELGKYLFTQFSHIHLLINLIVGVYVIKYYKNVKLFA